MICKTIKKIRMAALLGTAVLFSVNAAQAGFEWAPAPAPEKVMTAPSAPAPLPPVTKTAPVVVPQQQMPAVVPEVLPMDVATPAPREPMLQISPIAPVATVSPVSGVAIPPVPMKVYEDVQGFGSDIPLVTAMSQIVPADYAYSLDDQSLLAEKVSWSGDRPWNEALQAAVEPLNVLVTVVDNTVWLRDKGQLHKKMAKKEKSSVAPLPQMMKAPAPAKPEAPVAVAPPASNTVPLAAPSMKDGMPESVNNHIDNTHDAYPRRNPMPMMMKKSADSQSTAKEEPVAFQAKPTPLTAAPVKMTPPPAPSLVPSPAAPTADRAQNPALIPVAYNPAPKIASDPLEIHYWQAEKDMSLRATLMQWGAMTGTQIHWNSPYDYRIPYTVQTHATFSDAVTQILTSYEGLEPRPLGRLHPNMPHGPAVLIIDNYGSIQ